MQDGRLNADTSSSRKDDGVDWALSTLESAIKGSAEEGSAREALEFLRRAFSNARTSASTDPLTGLANRAWFYQILEERLTPGRGTCSSAAVLFLDLDGFKDVNDARGHQAGDSLLAEVANRISHCVREHDLVARHGGDEFVVLLEKIETPSVAHAVAARIIEAIAVPFSMEGAKVQLGISIGIALFPDHGSSAAELLKRADLAMYRAKNQGGRNYAVFGEREELIVPRAPRRSWTWELTPMDKLPTVTEVAISIQRKR